MITKTYSVTGMKCGGCVDSVKTALKRSPQVIDAIVQLDAPQAIVSLRQEVPVQDLQELVSQSGNYRIAENATEAEGMTTGISKKTGMEKVAGLLLHKKDCCK